MQENAMVMLVEHIDKIARSKARDVLYLRFANPALSPDAVGRLDLPRRLDWESHVSRQSIVRWLDANAVPWCPCGPVATTDAVCDYQGQIFIDMPFEPGSTGFRTLSDFLETPTGESKWPGVRFCVLPLIVAVKNAGHDEPGFWERWAEQL